MIVVSTGPVEKGVHMKQQSHSASNGYQVFVGNMSSRITESELRAMVESFGTVKNFSLVKAHAIGDSCSFAFFEMTDDYAVARAIAELNGKSIDGRCLRVRLEVRHSLH
jgi:RNA recognition motif-containing protein